MGFRVSARARAKLPDGLDLEALLADPAAHCVKTKAHRSVLHVAGQPGYFVKVFHPVSVRKRLTGLFPMSLAHREYRVARLFLANGIPTYRPVAHGWLYRGWMPAGSWFISEEIEGVRSLTDLLAEESGRDLHRKLMAAYGAIVARVHRMGVFLRDVNAGNMLVRLVDGEPLLYVIDHEMTRPLSGYGSVRRSRDIDYALRSGPRGAYSDEDRAVFMEAYETTLAAVR